jgi:hypothetical protein
MSKLYHSFPRRSGENGIEKGLLILESILKSGLLLVPETFSLKEETRKDEGKTITVFQKRICLTEISGNLKKELSGHSEYFGQFALEFELNVLRSISVNPVFYINVDKNSEIWPGAMGSFMARLCEIQEIITALSSLNDSIKNNDKPLILNDRGNKIELHDVETKGAEKIIRLLGRDRQPLDQQLGALQSICHMFYPTENTKNSPNLGYYRQKEWRIFSGLVLNGRPTYDHLSTEEIAFLLKLDNEFFSKVIMFPGGNASIVSRCEIIREINSKPIRELISRIFVPIGIKEKVQALLNKYQIKIEVQEY